ncbi:MAG: DUF805 domain-containing protein [Alphaproteobacteria bacterium]|nr:DUF805 domain-containing protein [Alphaproteobacteria bacterium]
MLWYWVALKKYAQFYGRARRKEFWYFVLFYTLFAVPFSIVDEYLLGIPILGTIYNLAFLIPFIAVGVRRLHDMGRSGWWMLFYTGLIPSWIVDAVVRFSGDASDETFLVFGISSIVGLVAAIVLIVFMVRKSQPGHNRYGSDPLEDSAPTA